MTWSGLRRAARAFPTLLRVGVAEAVAYRAEFFVWLLTTTMPLIMLALWSEVAREGGPIGGFSGPDFTAYFLAAFVVRQLTGVWVAWDMNREIREGLISMRLLRPLHPLAAYAAENLAVLPMRLLLSLPIAAAALWIVGRAHVTHDPVMWLLFAIATGSAWLLSFGIMASIGALAFFIESTLAVADLWFGLFFVLSGYFVPISLFPRWLARAADVLPFRSLLGLPVEMLIGRASRIEALRGLAIEWGWLAFFALLAVWLFGRGARRYSAYGA
ncbi:MAG: ABC transporter permease [Deltaproteobacteria bacterium]